MSQSEQGMLRADLLILGRKGRVTGFRSEQHVTACRKQTTQEFYR